MSQTKFLPVPKKFLPCRPNFSAKFSAPLEFSSSVLENICAQVGHKPSTFSLATRYTTSAPQLPCVRRVVISVLLLAEIFQCICSAGFLARIFILICSYWPGLSGRNFPSLSAVTGLDFPAASFPAWGNVKCLSRGTRRPGFFICICSYWLGFLGRFFWHLGL